MKCIDIVKYACKNTEELGILVEKAMCKIMNVSFNTKRKYTSLPKDVYDDIKQTIGLELKCMKMNHVGNMNMKYDFISEDGMSMSVKTIMSGNKICPQSIGQCSFKSFNVKTGLDLSTKNDFKRYFIDNKKNMLQKYLENCFCCDTIVIYKFESGFIYIINKLDESISLPIQSPIPEFSSNIEFDTSKSIYDWNESNTIYVKCNESRLSLGEIQIHNNRDCIKFRFNVDVLVKMINNNYIKNLSVNVYNLKTKYFFKIDNKKNFNGS